MAWGRGIGQPSAAAVWRSGGFAVLFAVAVVLGRQTIMDGTSLSLVWPAAGVAALWFCVQRSAGTRWLDYAVLAGLTFAINVWTGAGPALAVFFVAANVVQVAVLVALVGRWVPVLWGAGGREPLTGLRQLFLVLLAATTATAAGALVGPTAVWVLTGHWSWLTAAVWMTRNTTSVLLFLVLGLRVGYLLDAQRRSRAAAREGRREHTTLPLQAAGVAGRAEGAALVAVSLAAVAVFFLALDGLPLAFTLMAVTAWAALRFDTTVVAVHSFAVSVLVVVATLAGHGPFTAVADDATRAIIVQAYVGMTTVLALMLAMGRDERAVLVHRVRAQARDAVEHAELLDAVFTATPDGLDVFDARGRSLQRNAAARALVGDAPTDAGRAAWAELYRYTRPDGSALPEDELPVARALRGEAVTGVDIGVAPPGAQPRVLSVSARPLTVGAAAGGVVAAYVDVTPARQAAAELARARDLFAGVLDAATEQSIIGTDADGMITVFSGGAEQMLGLSRADAVGTSPARFHDPAEISARAAELGIDPGFEVFVHAARQERHETRRWTYRRADGSSLQVMLTVTAMRGPEGTIDGFIGVATDVTARLEAEQHLADSEQLFRLGFDTAPSAMMMASLDPASPGRLLRVNRSAGELTGLSETELLTRSMPDLMHPDDLDACRDLLAGLVEGRTQEARCEQRMVHADGSTRWGAVAASVVRPGRGAPYLVCLVQDITARRQAEEHLAHQALHDALTGLPNRTLLGDRLTHARAAARRSGQPLGLLYIDLDGFKAVNDTHGHAAGDQLLREVGRRLEACIRPGDTAARLGGDEFAVLCVDAGSRQALSVVAQRVVDVLSEPVALQEATVTVGASVGLRLADGEGATDAQLLLDADQAMYEAKRSGKGRVQLHDPDVEARAGRTARLLPQLQQALDHDRFVVHGQPVVDLTTGTVVAVEALLRWDHPTRGLLAPAEFLDVLEDSALMPAVGRLVLRDSCAMASQWAEQLGGTAPAVHVNVSGRQLETGHLHDDVIAALAAASLPAHRLVLEITETYVPRIADSLRRDVERLRGRGVQIAVDDLGTGHASLSRLVDLPLDMLKIDRTFVAGLGHDRACEAVVRGVLGIGEALGVTVVAEGVETPQQADHLRRLGADTAQGYLYSPPRPATELNVLLDRSTDTASRHP